MFTLELTNEELGYVLRDVCILQKRWKSLKDKNTISKRGIVEVCMPFKQKYAKQFDLKDQDILSLARENISVLDTFKVLKINME